MTDKKYVYIIADENNNLLRIANIPLLGARVTVTAIFSSKEDALKALAALGPDSGNRAYRIHESFKVTDQERA